VDAVDGADVEEAARGASARGVMLDTVALQIIRIASPCIIRVVRTCMQIITGSFCFPYSSPPPPIR
jgi:hypothetical protein